MMEKITRQKQHIDNKEVNQVGLGGEIQNG